MLLRNKLFFLFFVCAFECRTLQHLEEVALRTAQDLADGKTKISRSKKSLTDKVTNMALNYGFVKDFIFNKAKAQVMKQTNGLYPAPLQASFP